MNRFSETMLSIVIFLGIFIVILPLIAWVFMLGVGVVHHEWLPAMPTIGYKSSLIVCGIAFPLIRLAVASGDSNKD